MDATPKTVGSLKTPQHRPPQVNEHNLFLFRLQQREKKQIYHLRVVVPSRVPAVSPQVPVHVDVEAVVAVGGVKDGTAQTQGGGLGRLAELDLAADATWIITFLLCLARDQFGLLKLKRWI